MKKLIILGFAVATVALLSNGEVAFAAPPPTDCLVNVGFEEVSDHYFVGRDEDDILDCSNILDEERLWIEGNGGNDVIIGGIGDDFIRAGGGSGEGCSFGGDRCVDDVIDGGPGKDWIEGDGGDDILVGGTGDDFIRAGHGNDLLCGGVLNPTVASVIVHGDPGAHGASENPADHTVTPALRSVMSSAQIGTVKTSGGVGIVGATVSIKGGFKTTTEGGGNYTFDVPAGVYTVNARAEGFFNASIKDVTVFGGVTTMGIDFTLTSK
ncbi:carboxypeptidase regulatory-like domain-containing protein [Acidobacteria bacterium AH-259-O06]|nr:carboxypeptidase regulatory-like domain-containing protein [Acidobacteria bacterium AH-259-O06]